MMQFPWNDTTLTVCCINPIEIFAAKAVALLNRAAARDLFDMNNLLKYGLIDSNTRNIFRQSILFYTAIASEQVPEHFSFDAIEGITERKIRTDLTPVLRRASHFNLKEAQDSVKKYLEDILLPEGDLSFWKEFSKGKYRPDLLFDDPEILERIRNHPMALWKCGKNAETL